MTRLRRNNTNWTLRLILVIAPLAFVCIAVVAAMQNIHLAPAAPTFRQDQAELARLETNSDAHIADLRIAEARTDVERSVTPMTPSPAEESAIVPVPVKDDSALKPAQSKAVANRGRGYRASRSKRYQAELAYQRQRLSPPTSIATLSRNRAPSSVLSPTPWVFQVDDVVRKAMRPGMGLA